MWDCSHAFLTILQYYCMICLSVLLSSVCVCVCVGEGGYVHMLLFIAFIYIARFSALEQTHCAHVACDSEWVTAYVHMHVCVLHVSILTVGSFSIHNNIKPYWISLKTSWDSSDFTLVLEVHAPQYFFLFCFGCCWFYILKFWWGVCFTCPVPAFVRSFLYFLYVPHIPCSPPPPFFFFFFFFFDGEFLSHWDFLKYSALVFVCSLSFVGYGWGVGGTLQSESVKNKSVLLCACLAVSYACRVNTHTHKHTHMHTQ